MKCQKCGAELSSGVQFCQECGTKVERQVGFCRECGSKIDEGAKFCSNCGAKTDPLDATESPVQAEHIPAAEPVMENHGTPDVLSAGKRKAAVGDRIKEKGAELWSKLSLFEKATTIAMGVFALLCLVAFLAGKTLAGVIAIVAFTLVVVALLMKKQIIKTSKSWLYIVAFALAVLMIVPYVSVYRVDYGDAEKFQWSDIALGDAIPQPSPLFGEILINQDDSLSLYIYKIDQDDFDSYVADCKAWGYTVDADDGESSYYAYNADGYKLSLNFYQSDSKMHIDIEEAEEYGTLEWPASELASLLPVPQSDTGEITQDDEKAFKAYVSKTDVDAFNIYTAACADMGFSEDVHESEKRYTAQNADGYRLMIEYRGNNVIYIALYEPEYAVTIEIECVENWIFSTYDVDVYINDSFEGTINHGESEIFELTLTKGSYEVKFVNAEDDETTGAVVIDVQKAESLKFKISCHSSKIDVETVVGPHAEEDAVTDPSSDSESIQPTDVSTITVTMSEDELLGLDYADAEKYLREMGFTVFRYDTLDAGTLSELHNKVGAVEIKSWEFGKGDFEIGDTYDADAIVVLWYYEYEEVVVVPNLTAENCADLADLLALRDPCDPSVAAFASQYSGQIIEFDGCITNMQKHGNYNTRYDVLIGAGDYDANSMRGPNFRLTDVNFYDMNVTGGDSVSAGMNVRIVARVGEYNDNTSLFELDIISVEIR